MNYTTFSDLSPWRENNEDDFWGNLSVTLGSREGELQFFTQGQGAEEKFRFLCHILIAHLPLEGLEEAFEELKGMWEFYVEPVESPRFQIESTLDTQYVTQVARPTMRPEMISTE